MPSTVTGSRPVAMPSQAPSPRPAALDPRCLGRPVHLLPRVALRLQEALQRKLCLPWNRRYHARYDLHALSLQPLDRATREADTLDPDALRWLRTPGPAGLLACRIDRSLVLALLARRLGLGTDAPAAPDSPASPAPAKLPTATEDRLLQSLARQFCGLSLQLLAQAAQPDGTHDLQDLSPTDDLPSMQLGSLPDLGADAWEMRVLIRDAADPARDMPLRLALSGAYVQPLLRQLSAEAHRARPKPPAKPPLARRLTLSLQARLLEREMALGTVLDLQPGALIPIRLTDATVIVEGAALMRAAVAEHQGKLCLTSFEDLE
ncbi:FliM/FliN family flagellar motor C-terminal domain-containing protein [Roseateles amylovorans]|uniref:FliM/FliN family flagellar motor C-terminal domain-containing protein n=1 Tax=Roseateles amylovorans TaxID=2978473 RepID=A0ABY6AWD0_9BURK|nr:FliM/FliN family flagellar motor C-terminal domain-containing protein [Roseateles amylovorans]UXH76905.1 FliM/FliN family flagellar motor C-terminal domain-containing protein [Roseateles amylovorans]